MTVFSLLADTAPANEGLFAWIWKFLREWLFMIPLIITSVIGVTVVAYKIMALSSARVVPGVLAGRIRKLETGVATPGLDLVLAEFQRGESTLARLGSVAARFRGKTTEDITRAVEAASREEIHRLHDGIQMLDVIITVAPLLGLLGTSTGLVTIFKKLGEEATDQNHLMMARGIAEALKSTIFGLAIAVPAIFAHSIFSRRIESFTARLESLLAHLSHVFQAARPNPDPP